MRPVPTGREPPAELAPHPPSCHTHVVAAMAEQVCRRAPRSRLVWGAWAWAAVAFLFLFLAVLASFYDRFPADERIAHAIQDIDVPALGGFFDFTNTLGDAWFYIPLTLGVALAFAVARAGWEAALLPLTFIPRGLNSLV